MTEAGPGHCEVTEEREQKPDCEAGRSLLGERGLEGRVRLL